MDSYLRRLLRPTSFAHHAVHQTLVSSAAPQISRWALATVPPLNRMLTHSG